MTTKTGKCTLKFLLSSFFLSSLAIATPAPAQQACQNKAEFDIKTDLVQNVIQALHDTHVILAVCLPSPVHIDQTYVALISQEKTAACEEQPEQCNNNLFLLLVDNRNKKITRRYIGRGTLAAGPSIVTNVMIDTGDYQLNPSSRASAIQLERERPLHSSVIVTTELHLFTENNEQFQPIFGHSINENSAILTGLFLTENENSKDNTLCKRYHSEAVRTVDFGTYHNGFRDLIVKMQASDVTGQKTNRTCTAQTIAVTSGETVIPYDGHSYRLPIWLSYPR